MLQAVAQRAVHAFVCLCWTEDIRMLVGWTATCFGYGIAASDAEQYTSLPRVDAGVKSVMTVAS